MKIPQFKPSRRLLDDLGIPCLVARVKNSTLPKVAILHIKKCKRDPVCRISLRVSDSKEISDWLKKMLKSLFEKEGLPVALKEGMKEYQTSNDFPGYDRTDEQCYRDIKKHGIVPLVTLSEIVIDEIKRETIIVGDTEWDGNLNEHGISVYLRAGRWRFDYAERLYDYISALQAEIREKVLADTSLPIKPGAATETDISFLFGIWEFDKEEAQKMLLKSKCSRANLKMYLGVGEGLRYFISPKALQVTSGDPAGTTHDYVLLECERVGEIVRMRYHESDKEQILTRSFHYRDNRLVCTEGIWLVLRKNTNKVTR